MYNVVSWILTIIGQYMYIIEYTIIAYINSRVKVTCNFFSWAPNYNYNYTVHKIIIAYIHCTSHMVHDDIYSTCMLQLQ